LQPCGRWSHIDNWWDSLPIERAVLPAVNP
jgi:hypothetical protein